MFSCFLRPSCHRTSMALLWLEHDHHFHSQSSYFTWFLYHRPEYNGWCFSLLASFFFFFSYHWFQLLDLFLDQFVYSISWLNSFEIKHQTRDWNNWHRVSGWLFSRYHHCFFSFFFFLGKEVHGPWTFYLDAALFRQSFHQLQKIPHSCLWLEPRMCLSLSLASFRTN